jgi:hypothetical protein
MNGKMRYLAYVLYVSFIIIVALVNLHCQYDYSSPQPGVIEIHFRTISTLIGHSELNNFILNINSVTAIRADGGKQVVYEDIKAIDVSTNPVNTLDYAARDSAVVIGSAYAPPGQYVGVGITFGTSEEMILQGYQVIKVVQAENFDGSLYFRLPYPVSESHKTIVVLTIDLDKSLSKGAFTYTFSPVYYVSSYQVL